MGKRVTCSLFIAQSLYTGAMHFNNLNVPCFLLCISGWMAKAEIINSINYSEEYTVGISNPIANLFPVDINQLNFVLYSQSNKYFPYKMKYGDLQNLGESLFDGTLPTKFIIHGWLSSYKADQPQGLKNAFISTEKVNVVLLDYEEYNSPYITLVSRAEALGKKFADFINFLIENTGLRRENIHVIGHSMGAHIAGFAGKNLNPKVSRITGIDPAGPGFHDKKPENRLSGSDAVYVDAILTSSFSGIGKPIAQANFYPHGGAAQPLCIKSDSAARCDHIIGYKYYVQTIINQSLYPARLCATVNEARIADPHQNVCAVSTALMGEGAITSAPPGIYYVEVQ